MTMISELSNPDTYNSYNKNSDPDWLWLLIVIGLLFLAWIIGKVIVTPFLLALGPIGTFISGFVVIWFIYDLMKDIICLIKKWFNI